MQIRKEMEATWNQKGEDYKTQIEKIEEKLRNAELAVSKVRNCCQAPTQLPTPSPLQPKPNSISTPSQFNSSNS